MPVIPHFIPPLKQNSHAIGKWYENVATTYLRKQNYHILEKNYRSGHSEIDLIALSPKSLLVFIEVKYRKAHPAFPIEAALSLKQQQRVMQAAEHFLSIHEALKKRNSQFDVILISKIISEKKSIPPHSYNTTVPTIKENLKTTTPPNTPKQSAAQTIAQLQTECYTLTHIEQAFEYTLT